MGRDSISLLPDKDFLIAIKITSNELDYHTTKTVEAPVAILMFVPAFKTSLTFAKGLLFTNTVPEETTVLGLVHGIPIGVVPEAGVSTSPPTITGRLFAKTVLDPCDEELRGFGGVLHAPDPPVSFP